MNSTGMSDITVAILSILIVVHGILLFRLCRGLTWWMGRLFDALEAFQHSLWSAFVPMVKVWWQHFGEAHARLTRRGECGARCGELRCQLELGHAEEHRSGFVLWRADGSKWPAPCTACDVAGYSCTLEEGHAGDHISEDGVMWRNFATAGGAR